MIIEKDIFNFMFDILEYYKNSDVLNKKVFKIIENIFQARNDDIQDMLKYFLEDTNLIKFLIQNGPNLMLKSKEGSIVEKKSEKDQDPSTPEAKKEKDSDKPSSKEKSEEEK